ncbi:MAG: NUDIX hydrolase [Candidatus Eremiobacteraeota bacterium]|nr:NUDIX hydrolase [Candidatus Eremiobacteraeota bacterium]
MAYRRISKREVYRNRWIAVEVHAIVHPSGVEGEHVLIDVPAPSGVLVDDDGDLLFARQPRFAIGADTIEIVKGGANAGEDALACAQRELREELGIIARSWVSLGILYEIPSIVEKPLSLFLAREIEHVVDEQEDVERIDLVRVPAADALTAAVQGRINDAVTVAALLRYAGVPKP